MRFDHECIGYGSTIRIVVGTQFLAWRYDMISRVDYDQEWCIGRIEIMVDGLKSVDGHIYTYKVCEGFPSHSKEISLTIRCGWWDHITLNIR
jgi:hypothetical protein